MSFSCDWYRSIDGCDVIKCYRRSQISQIAALHGRRSQHRKVFTLSLCAALCDIATCDVAYRPSAFLSVLPFLNAFNARDAMGSPVAPF